METPTRAEAPTNARRLLTGHLLILAAAVLWSTSGLFAKSPLFADWPIEQGGYALRGPLLAFWRALFASAVLVPLVRRPRWTVRLLPALLAFAAMNFTYLTALTMTSAANAIWLQYTAPAWVFLFAVTTRRETIQPRDWWLLASGVAGVAIILVFEMRGQAWSGVVYGLLAGVTYACVLLSLRSLRDVDAAWVVAVNHLATAALFLPYVVVSARWPNGPQLACLAGFGIVQMGVPYLLFARGLQTTPSHEASGIVLLEPVLVPVWVFLAWRNDPGYEPPAWWTLLGGGCILVGLSVRYAALLSPARLGLGVQSKKTE